MGKKADTKPFLGEGSIVEMDGDDGMPQGPAMLSFSPNGRGRVEFFDVEKGS